MKTLKTDNLSCDAITSTPQTVDWSEAAGENCDGWTAYEVNECSECGEMVVTAALGEIEHRDLDDGNCCGTVYAEGPQMNYWYPVRIDDCGAAAREISSLPLCVIEFEDGTTGLALTGGGMDLSWEICEAFIRIGCLPPTHFCDLPLMAGRGESKEDRQIVEACRKSCEVQANWLAGTRDRLYRNFIV